LIGAQLLKTASLSEFSSIDPLLSKSFQFFESRHPPIGALLVAGIIAVFFQDIRKAFLPLVIGLSPHFTLNFFLVHVHGGMKLLFPFSWEGWQYYLIRSEDYWVTIGARLAALLVYGIYQYQAKRKNSSPQEEKTR